MAKTEIRSTQVKDLTVLVDDLRDFGPTDGGGLNLNVAAGRIRNDNTITDKTSQVVALTDNATNYVELSTAGVASTNTSAFTAGSIAIAQVVTASGDITSVTDKRAWVATPGISAASSFLAFGAGQHASASTGYYIPYSNVGSGTLADAQHFKAPVGATLRNFRISISIAPGGSETVIATLMVNGVATSITATISGASKTASDLSNSAAISAGDDIVLRLVSSAGANSTSAWAASLEVAI